MCGARADVSRWKSFVELSSGHPGRAGAATRGTEGGPGHKWWELSQRMRINPRENQVIAKETIALLTQAFYVTCLCSWGVIKWLTPVRTWTCGARVRDSSCQLSAVSITAASCCLHSTRRWDGDSMSFSCNDFQKITSKLFCTNIFLVLPLWPGHCG